ncbi:MAG TPA: dienelactone hydrolase family protein [Streptosporangiaceae bacterium]|nr:dienelactone hydrolase family protein [Streptosporangiaceae bacterium]
MPDTIDVVLGAGAGAFPGVLAEPDGPPAGGVIVVQEAYGLTGHIRNICGRLADAGYLAVAPALFHRLGSPVLGYDELQRAMPMLGQLHADEIRSDIAAALDLLRQRGLPAARCGAVGFCMGGSVTFAMATELDFGAAVTFYGGGVAAGRFGFPGLAEAAPSLRVPWLGLYGDQDHTIGVGQVETLRERAALAPVPTELVRYADAGHGFNCDDRDAFVPAAASDAWSRTLAWLRTYLGDGPGQDTT